MGCRLAVFQNRVLPSESLGLRFVKGVSWRWPPSLLLPFTVQHEAGARQAPHGDRLVHVIRRLTNMPYRASLMPMEEVRLKELLMEAIGKRMASAREKRAGRLSRSELGRRAGVSRATVSAVEAGQQGVALLTLCRFANALSVEPGSLLPDLSGFRELQKLALAGDEPQSEEKQRRAEDIVDDFFKGEEDE